MEAQVNPSQEAYKEWYLAGLQALVSANEIGEKTTQKLKKYITAKALNELMESGSKAASEQADVVKKLLTEAGGKPGSIPNVIMEGIDQAADQIAQSEDKDVRDAGVITSAQIALHYYIAAYGGLASTAKHLGLVDQAERFSTMVDEIKTSDEAYSRLAEESVNQKAAA